MKRKILFIVCLTIMALLTLSVVSSTALKHPSLLSKTSSKTLQSLTSASSSTSNVTVTPGAIYERDCNDPDNPIRLLCAEPVKSAIPPGYPYYVGHDEPRVRMFSTTYGSANNFQWKFQLPQTDPTATQNAANVANFELYPAVWFSVALCDPVSTPFTPCTPNSDSNTAGQFGSGSAILELQFYPPKAYYGTGFLGCDNTQWCAAMTIDEFNVCGEPITSASITPDGDPDSSPLLMSPGDDILITINDTSNGIMNTINDLTSSNSGSMVGSASNGFTQTPSSNCTSPTPFTYHAEYATALPANTGSWFAGDNVAYSYELGHWELCGDSGCSNLPDADSDDTGCNTVLGVGGCTGKDVDNDGTSYQAVWPDGLSSHPRSFIIGAPSANGFGPESINPYGGPSPRPYTEGYSQMAFASNGNQGALPFYPFFSQSGTGPGPGCELYFGNDIPGVTTNDFGQTKQYSGTLFDNPCLPGLFDYNMKATPLTPLPSTASFPTILTGESATYKVTLTLVSGPTETVTLLSDHNKEPTGSTSSFSPATLQPTIDGISTNFTIVTSPTGGVGYWILHIHGSSVSFPCPSVLGCKTIDPLTSLGTYNFSVSISPPDQTVLSGGGAAAYELNFTRAPDTFCPSCPFVFQVPPLGLSMSALPTGMKFQFGTGSIVPTLSGATTTLIVGTTSGSPLGNISFTVSGFDGNGGSRSGSANLHIYDFAIFTLPTSLRVLTTGSNHYSVSVELIPGSSTVGLPNISLTLAGLPANTTYSFSTVSGPASGFNSTITINTTNAPMGNYTLTISGIDFSLFGGGIRTNHPTLQVLTPAQALPLIGNQVKTLQSKGVLTSGQAGSLIAKLNLAVQQLKSGDKGVACSILTALVNQVNSFVSNGVLTKAQANSILGGPLGVYSIVASIPC